MALKQIYANNVASYIDQPLGGTVSDTSIYIVPADQDLFPSPVVGVEFFLATLENTQTKEWEIVRVTARSGNQLTVIRSQEGESIKSFPLGSKIQLRVTKETLERLYDHSEEIATYVHDQTVATATWTINHNLNRYPSVSIEIGTWLAGVFTKTSDAFADISHTSDTTITITFSEPIAGRVICS